MINLANTNLQISPLCLGGNVFGWTADVVDSEAVLSQFVGNGGNFIDTADMYSQWGEGHVGGESERIIGNWLKRRGDRNSIVLATKVAKMDKRRGLSAQNIRAACEESLQRLKTDYIDLYYAHEDDSKTSIEETLEAFDALVQGQLAVQAQPINAASGANNGEAFFAMIQSTQPTGLQTARTSTIDLATLFGKGCQ